MTCTSYYTELQFILHVQYLYLYFCERPSVYTSLHYSVKNPADISDTLDPRFSHRSDRVCGLVPRRTSSFETSFASGRQTTE